MDNKLRMHFPTQPNLLQDDDLSPKKNPRRLRNNSPEKSPSKSPRKIVRQDQSQFRRARRNVAIRKSIEGDENKIHETFQLLERKQSKTDIVYIVMCLKTHFLFTSLSDSQLQQLAKQMFYCKLSKGVNIINQGDKASSFFIIEKGKIQILINNVAKKELVTGNGFGELALLYSAPRSATCRAAEECYLWGIDRKTFRKSVEEIMLNEQQQNRKYLKEVKFFSYLTESQKDSLAGVLIAQRFSKEQVIVNEGDQASSFYIIAEGRVGAYKDGKQLRVLEQGEFFGEQVLMGDSSFRPMTIKALDRDTKVLALARDTIVQLLGDQIQIITQKNICKWAIQKSELFEKVPASIVDKLLELATFKKLRNGEKIFSKGQKVGILAVVVEGSAINDLKQKVAKEGEMINEFTLKDNFRGGIHSNDVIMEQGGVVGLIDYESYRKQNGSVEKLSAVQQLKESQAQSMQQMLKSKTINDLVFISKLGSGQFGSVYLCKLKGNKQLFALKYVTRRHVKEYKLEKHIQQEKWVLEVMDHPFIMTFFRSFKDSYNIYFLTEYIAGVELFDAIRILGLLKKSEAQFYISQMILMMEYIHTAHEIVYRDLKPENVMVDHTGYLKLIDMGTAKVVKSGQKTFTIIGTPHYMAPEMISGKGYNQFSDMFSIGVCLYEFVCGNLPYGEDSDDPYTIYQDIMKNPIKYPTYMTDKTAKGIIEQLMNKTPELRLGGSYSALKSHTWFRGWDYNALQAKTLKPPVLPPKEKIATDAQVEKEEKKNISVASQINEDTAGEQKVLATRQDSEWDKVF